MTQKTKLVPVAVDWHEIMYYGDPKETPMIIGTQHKNRSNYAFDYFTASVLVDGQQRMVVVAIPLDSRSDAYTGLSKRWSKKSERWA